MKVQAKTPVRIGLIGGGTDVNPFASEYGGQVLSLAVDLHHQVVLEPNGGSQDKGVVVKALGQSKQFGLGDKIIYGREEKLDLVYATINYFKPLIKTGFQLRVDFEGESSGGLGSSGSAGVAIIGAFNNWLKRGLSLMEMAFLAWRMEVKELGWVGGKQDQLAAAFGGINLLTFGAKDSVGVIPLEFSQKLIERIQAWTTLFYIGGKRHSAELQKKLKKGMSKEDKREALKGLKRGVDQVIDALESEDFIKVGRVLDEAWQFKKRSNPSIATGRINDLYQLAKKTGAYGGKVMGAGAGGHMFFFCPPEKQAGLTKALEEKGCQALDFNFDFEGLQVWRQT